MKFNFLSEGSKIILLEIGLVFLSAFALNGCVEIEPTVIGLRPEYPPVRYRLFADAPGKLPHLVYVQIDSLSPTFRWETVDTHLGKQKDEGGKAIGNISEVTYELKVWKQEKGRPGELVYWRQNLPAPSHQIESPLKSSTKYVWTVRAHFKLDGQKRVTEWGHSKYPEGIFRPNPRDIPHEQNPNYSRFQTPGK